jgi:hypothetical protein
MTPNSLPTSLQTSAALVLKALSYQQRQSTPDMDDVASTRAEANDHLQRLREARGIKGDCNDISNDANVSSLNEALNL